MCILEHFYGSVCTYLKKSNLRISFCLIAFEHISRKFSDNTDILQRCDIVLDAHITYCWIRWDFSEIDTIRQDCCPRKNNVSGWEWKLSPRSHLFDESTWETHISDFNICCQNIILIIYPLCRIPMIDRVIEARRLYLMIWPFFGICIGSSTGLRSSVIILGTCTGFFFPLIHFDLSRKCYSILWYSDQRIIQDLLGCHPTRSMNKFPIEWCINRSTRSWYNHLRSFGESIRNFYWSSFIGPEENNRSNNKQRSNKKSRNSPLHTLSPMTLWWSLYIDLT